MNELLDNINEFLESGEDNLKKERFNAAISDFFKAIVVACDYMIYRDMKILPKNHSERFSLLNKYFKEIYGEVSSLFIIYTNSYNFKIKKEDALKAKNYAYKLESFINKK
ncbi:MAG: hypothetical protein KKE23_03535 [Nanoarchaeota archaeon]|nr:hypothetical protein [Nanoarchaeota archaeon]